MTILKSQLVFHFRTNTYILELNTSLFELTFTFTDNTLTPDNLIMSILSLQYQLFFFHFATTILIRTISDIDSFRLFTLNSPLHLINYEHTPFNLLNYKFTTTIPIIRNHQFLRCLHFMRIIIKTEFHIEFIKT